MRAPDDVRDLRRMHHSYKKEAVPKTKQPQLLSILVDFNQLESLRFVFVFRIGEINLET